MKEPEKYSEKELLKSVAEGNEIAFRKIIEQHHQIIYTLGYRLSNSKELAEDLVQDVFLKLWIHRSKLLEIENLPGWIYQTAKNILLNTLTKLGREKKYKTENAVNEWLNEYSLQNIAEYRELDNTLKEAVKMLPLRQRQTYELIKEQHMSRMAAAQTLNVSQETIKSNLELAVRFIRARCLHFLDEKGIWAIIYILLRT